jgi:hypothetical protein
MASGSRPVPGDSLSVMTQTERLAIVIPEVRTVSGLLVAHDEPTALFVMAHGAGAGMNHGSMEAVASDLCRRGIATLRYLFPYMEAGSRRPDRRSVAHAAVRAAGTTAARLLPGVPLLAGGKSFGARMTTQAQPDRPLPGVRTHRCSRKPATPWPIGL